MISILLPTRKRPKGLREAIESLYSLAHKPDSLETILRVDNNDPTDYSAYRNRGNRVIVGERWGYKNMHLYYDEVSRAATGRWLLMWNDDMTMLTKDWDALLLNFSSKLCVQFLKRDIYAPKNPDNEYEHIDTAYPAWPKTLFDLMGRVSLNCHCDSWLADTSEDAKIKVLRHDIVIHHDRPEDETASERVYDWEAYQGGAMRGGRDEDVAKIMAFLAKHPEMRP